MYEASTPSASVHLSGFRADSLGGSSNRLSSFRLPITHKGGPPASSHSAVPTQSETSTRNRSSTSRMASCPVRQVSRSHPRSSSHRARPR